MPFIQQGWGTASNRCPGGHLGPPALVTLFQPRRDTRPFEDDACLHQELHPRFDHQMLDHTAHELTND